MIFCMLGRVSCGAVRADYKKALIKSLIPRLIIAFRTYLP